MATGLRFRAICLFFNKKRKAQIFIINAIFEGYLEGV
jgi:hypothetical protein